MFGQASLMTVNQRDKVATDRESTSVARVSAVAVDSGIRSPQRYAGMRGFLELGRLPFLGRAANTSGAGGTADDCGSSVVFV